MKRLNLAALKIYNRTNKHPTLQSILAHMAQITSLDTEIPNEFILQANQSSAKATDENILNYRQAMKANDSELFEEDMEKDMQHFINKYSFSVVHISTVPRGKIILHAVWTFKRKTTHSGEVCRHRSRLCVDGSRQIEGQDYKYSYPPVVNWSTIRLLFILSIIFNLKSRQVDYVQAFPQATLNEEVYMHIPKGFFSKDSDGKEKNMS